MGRICGTLRLGLGQEKLMDCHWESQLLQDMDIIEAPMVIYQMDKFRVQNWEILLLRLATPVICHG